MDASIDPPQLKRLFSNGDEMLNQGKLMNGSKGVPTVTWTNAEWEAIATELKRRHPNRMTHVWTAFNFALEEFEDAVENVIKQERQKSFDDFEDARQPLFDAFKRLKIEGKMSVVDLPKKTTFGGITGIFWTDAQYEQVLLELERTVDNFFDEGMKNVKSADVLQAEKVLPKNLHRKSYRQVVSFKTKAAKVWNAVLARRAAEPPKPVDVIVEPPQLKSHENKTLATAMHEAFQSQTEPKTKHKKHVQWKPSEWLDIAREMHRQNPHANFLTSTFEVIDIESVRAAQREAMPSERRRKIYQSSGLQGPLVAAFKALRIEIIAAEIAKMAQAEVVIEPAIEAPAIEFSQPVAPSTVLDRQSPSSDFTARLMTAAAPLIDMLIGEVVKKLAPQLTTDIINAVMPRIEAALVDLKQPSKPTFLPQPVIPQLTKQEIAAALPVPAEKPRKPKIAVLAFPGVHHHELERPFPQFEFIWIEEGRGIKEAAAKCELFMACQICMTPSNIASIKAHVAPEKLKTVTGGISSLKRQIDVWLIGKNEQASH